MNLNIEHDLIEAESTGFDIPDDYEDEITVKNYDDHEIERRLMQDAKKRADKLIKKNKTELKRLKTHAGECLLNGNFAGYSYAIKKLRKFYKQPYNDDLIKSMWTSSRGAIVDVAVKAIS